MFSEFIKLSEKNLNVYPSACMIAVGGLDTKLCYLSSLAKSQGRRVIKLQHGGYMGYHKLGYYKNQIWTKEFNDCDYYLTWGWGLPDELNLGKTKFIEFVSPWLSERKQYWKNIKLYQYKDYKFDVLLAHSLIFWNQISFKQNGRLVHLFKVKQWYILKITIWLNPSNSNWNNSLI